jgi:hypothetical protein
MKSREIVVCLLFTAAVGLCGCDDGSQALFSNNPLEAKSPAGDTPLLGVSQSDAYWALLTVRQEIRPRRAFGVRLAVDTFKAYLAAKGLDASVLNGITDATIGGPMPGARWTPKSSGTISQTKSGLIGSSAHALEDDEVDGYYGCPLDAPDSNEGSPCEAMVDEVLAQVEGLLEEHKEEVARLVAEQFGCLEATALQFVEAWAQYAEQYGAEVAMIYARHELKAAGFCDVQVNAGVVSYRLGVEQGWEIVLELKAWAEQQVETCVVNITEIVEQVRVMANSQIDAFMTENAVCVDADVSAANQNLQAAEGQRRVGIEAGIEERIEVLRTELQRTEQIANEPGGPCWDPPPDEGGGDGGDGDGDGNSPLVIDLAGDFELEADGVTLSSGRVSFDLLASGRAQSVTWIGTRGALVAIDLDGDGRITSGAELMGSSATCDGRRCYDGVEALARFDSNADGVVDRRDPAYERLLLWQDHDQDAVSQPGELSTLAQRGVHSIGVAASYPNLASVAGRISAELRAVTDRGAKPVYDVWFRTKMEPQDLPLFLPR